MWKKITNNNFSIIFEGDNFEIKNGEIIGDKGIIEGEEVDAGYALFIGENPTSNVKIRNITTKGGINIYNSQNVVLEDVDITATTFYSVWCDQGGNATIKNGTFKSSEKTTALLGMADVDTTLNIEDGKFISGEKALVLVGDEFNHPTIIGGQYDKPVDDEYLSEKVKARSEKKDPNGKDGIYGYYTSIEEAMRKSEDGSKLIDMTWDESEKEVGDFNLNLNSKDIEIKTWNESSYIDKSDGIEKISLPTMAKNGYRISGWKFGDKILEPGKVYELEKDLGISIDSADKTIIFEAIWELIPDKPIHPTYDHTQIIGANRYETAGKIADKLGSYDTAVLVNATSTMSDGLSAAGLAGKEDAAILLVKKDSIPKATMDRLSKVKKVYIIGGENAISQKVVTQLKKDNVKVEVERLGGKTRVETSEIVAKKLGNYKKAFVVNGFKGEADAMSASAVAARYDAPILLTNGNSSSIAKKSGVSYYVVGGKSVMNDSIVKQYNAERIAGKDRYETNREMVNEFYGESETLYFANGETLVDALTASTIAKDDGLVLVGRKSDNKILNRKNTIQVGGMNFDVDFVK